MTRRTAIHQRRDGTDRPVCGRGWNNKRRFDFADDPDEVTCIGCLGDRYQPIQAGLGVLDCAICGRPLKDHPVGATCRDMTEPLGMGARKKRAP